jgi:hypothetical protein
VAKVCTVWSKDCNAPVAWSGQFSFASGASEAFLLEYANNMTVGWNRIPVPPQRGAPWSLRDMMQLHEFFFDQMDRQPYLAKIQGSNLVREISDQINRKAGGPMLGQCPRASAESRFVGLVGHDTNLASVGALLNLGWRFDDASLPPDTFGLPANNALPAGALVFELRKGARGYFVRIAYVTQSLLQMRGAFPTHIAFACGRSTPRFPIRAKDRIRASWRWMISTSSCKARWDRTTPSFPGAPEIRITGISRASAEGPHRPGNPSGANRPPPSPPRSLSACLRRGIHAESLDVRAVTRRHAGHRRGDHHRGQQGARRRA